MFEERAHVDLTECLGVLESVREHGGVHRRAEECLGVLRKVLSAHAQEFMGEKNKY